MAESTSGRANRECDTNAERPPEDKLTDNTDADKTEYFQQ